MQAFGEIEKVLVLSGGFLYLVYSFLLQPLKRLSFLKGASVFTKRLRSSEAESSNLSETAVSNSSESSRTSQRFLQKLGGGVRVNW